MPTLRIPATARRRATLRRSPQPVQRSGRPAAGIGPVPGVGSVSIVRLAACLVLLALPACSQRRPVLYPNATYQRMGPEVAEGAVEYCLDWAEEHVASGNAAAEVAKETAAGGATGGAVGGATGAVFGRPGLGAAAGAAGQATRGFIRGIFNSREPDPLYKRFVERCLREEGYDPAGWR